MCDAEILVLNNALLHGYAAGQTGTVLLSAQVQGQDALLLQVMDDGSGIAAEHLDSIFDPFFSTRFGQGGSGLGLHICHNLVSVLLQGSISVSAGPDKGCCFGINLRQNLST